MFEALITYLLSGQFWFAMFLATLGTVAIINWFGYGRSGVVYFEARRTQIQLVAVFVVMAILVAGIVSGITAGVQSVQ
ncbi:hypothetical protein OB919_15760 [Halobacteria archaeon AArc-curdl1]|uniref:Uncharacterized protein n=1 Tax=Natronosalvus hydrolyticus TaxID=2979988 RepID=A0AAP2ZBC5_9EURY|nr:hypothetical protein [Halobacteria archaeon AArc-curdl1]